MLTHAEKEMIKLIQEREEFIYTNFDHKTDESNDYLTYHYIKAFGTYIIMEEFSSDMEDKERIK
jgi:hypothetical protein